MPRENYMKRNYLKVGDKSSAGGTAIDGIPGCTHSSGELTFIGGKVSCPACSSTGHIAPKGPRWPGTMMGKEPALEGDVCICKCSQPPAMIASQGDMFQTFESHALSSMGVGSDVASDPAFATHLQRILIRDSSTGLPLPNQEYGVAMGGERQFGRTDDRGYAVVRSSGEKEFNLHVIFSAPKRDLKPQEDI